MKIVFFQFVPHHGGASKSCIELACRLKNHCEVSIIDPYGCDENFVNSVLENEISLIILKKKEANVTIGGKGNKLLRLIKVIAAIPELMVIQFRLKRVLKKINPDIILTDNFKSGFLLGVISSLNRFPLILYLRGWYIPQMVPWYGRWLMNSRASFIIAVSQATRAALLGSNVQLSKIRVIHNSVDSSKIRAEIDRNFEEDIPQKGRKIKLLLPATVLKNKGQDTAIKAMKLLIEKGHDAVLWIAGDVPPFDGSEKYFNDLKNLANNLGVSNRIEFLGYRSDIHYLMKECTYVILPSKFEGHPRIILEAMAIGKPVIATPAGGILDMVLDDLTGKLFDIDDFNMMANCIEFLIKNPEKENAIISNARDYIDASFRPESQLDKILNLFNSVLKEKK